MGEGWRWGCPPSSGQQPRTLRRKRLRNRAPQPRVAGRSASLRARGGRSLPPLRLQPGNCAPSRERARRSGRRHSPGSEEALPKHRSSDTAVLGRVALRRAQLGERSLPTRSKPIAIAREMNPAHGREGRSMGTNGADPPPPPAAAHRGMIGAEQVRLSAPGTGGRLRGGALRSVRLQGPWLSAVAR